MYFKRIAKITNTEVCRTIVGMVKHDLIDWTGPTTPAPGIVI